MIIHRADRFGLAQLYQLRGRVGRAKMRAYAYLTTPGRPHRSPRPPKSGCKVLADLDSLGAGFQLASHDLDIRGAGNLLGDEQSGHITRGRLRALPVDARGGDPRGQGGRPSSARREGFSPQITVDAPIMIPEDYVPDLDLRMGLYRRLNELEDAGRDRAASPPS